MIASIGGNSADWLEGGGGDNTLDGRGGTNDTADYLNTDAPLTIDLTIGKATHFTGVDTVTNIEQFRATNWSDKLIGDDGNNLFWAMNGNDTLRGGGGIDTLEGNNGNDVIDGGAGNDRVFGGYDDDRLTGGADADKFAFRDSEFGNDHITDFVFGEGDRIDFSESAMVNQFSDVTVTDDGLGNALIRYATQNGQSSIVLDGVAPAAVHQDWFLY